MAGCSQAPLSQPEQPINVTQTPNSISEEGNFVRVAVNQVGSSVVLIDAERTVAVAPWLFDHPLFHEFFGEDVFPEIPREKLERSVGSGFIIEADGVILTNAHLVKGADKVTVTLTDGRRLLAQVQGLDELTDLAVVKIESTGSELPIAPLGDSDQVQVGDWAIAVGNPLGLNNTVTFGIISSLERSSTQVGIPDKRLNFIQTDAAINPGNSGGPLLNASGEVIGINTAILSGAEGIGFAIPINQAKAIKDALARGEQIPHPYIGVQIVTQTPELAQARNRDRTLQLPEINGVLIVKVLPNTPAAAAGLSQEDIIIKIDGQSVTTVDQLQQMVEESGIGQRLQLKVRRGNQTVTLSVEIGDLQEAG